MEFFKTVLGWFNKRKSIVSQLTDIEHIKKHNDYIEFDDNFKKICEKN